MKAKVSEYLMTGCFCGFLALMAVLYLLLPKEPFSELEKRYLAEPPVLTGENLASGSFGQEVDAYMADYIPFRDFFVGVNAYFERATLRQVTEDIYLAEQGRLVEKPVVWNELQANRNTAAVNSFAQAAETPVDLMVIPSGGWAAKDEILGIADPYTDDEIIAALYEKIQGAAVRDVTGVFAGAPELYYRTDHHWTSRGAYEAYRAYMEQLGLPSRAETDFTVETADGFHGTTHQRSALWLVPPEQLEMWTGSRQLSVTHDKTENHKGAFFRERLEEMDMYTVFLDGNHPLVTIENPEAPLAETLVVVRDSYANCLGSFLAQSYQKVVLVDLRYYRTPVSQLCTELGADRVLVCYSLSNFMTDNNLIRLK